MVCVVWRRKREWSIPETSEAHLEEHLFGCLLSRRASREALLGQQRASYPRHGGRGLVTFLLRDCYHVTPMRFPQSLNWDIVADAL